MESDHSLKLKYNGDTELILLLSWHNYDIARIARLTHLNSKRCLYLFSKEHRKLISPVDPPEHGNGSLVWDV